MLAFLLDGYFLAVSRYGNLTTNDSLAIDLLEVLHLETRLIFDLSEVTSMCIKLRILTCYKLTQIWDTQVSFDL